MHDQIERLAAPIIQERLKYNPAVAILGPRQCGKSTLAKSIMASHERCVYLDLELDSDRNKLRDPEGFFSHYSQSLVCLDEIQRVPELFPVMRGLIDRRNENGQYLILGSASRDLIRQSSETLAGRISYLELTPFVLSEIDDKRRETMLSLWSRGGYPRSYLAEHDDVSYQWRRDFISTYLERDIPQLGFSMPSRIMERLWTMCAHYHGQLINYSKIGDALGTSYNTAKSYIDILSKTFVLRALEPCHQNTKKRLMKSPKIYIRDTGLLHALLSIKDYDDLLGHPSWGASWEGFVIETICSHFPHWGYGFYRTSNGAEIDLIIDTGKDRYAVECKSSMAPAASKGFWNGMADLGISRGWIAAPVADRYPLRRDVYATPLAALIEELRSLN